MAATDKHAVQLLANASESTVAMIGGSRIAERVASGLDDIRKAGIGEFVRPDDRASFFLPVVFKIDGKLKQGGVLLLEDRAVFAWRVGLLSGKAENTVVRFDEIDPAAVHESSGTVAISSERRDWEIHEPPGLGGVSISNLLAGVLTGAVTPEWE